MKSISLGYKNEFVMPASPVSKDGSGMEYPCTHLEGGKELKSLPEEGEITFRFKRKRISEEGDEITLCLQLQEVLDAKEGKALKTADEALSELRDETEDDSEEMDD